MEKQKHIPVSEEKAMEKERQDRCWSLGEGKYVKVKVIPIHELESFLRDLQFERCSLCCYAVVTTSRPIVFAGDTSHGKSSLINKMLNEKLIEDRMLETTSTFVKLRNSDRVRTNTESDTGNIKENDFTEKCDLESKDGVKGYTFFVDTPGIGSSEKATQKFMDYLPDADSFVFEINVQHGVGVQIDREIPNSIVYRKLNKRVPWFDPQDVIFVPNKWDTIKCIAMGSDENSSDEALSDKLLTALESMIKKNEERRVIRHLRFLEDLPTNVSKGLNAEPQLRLIIEKDQQEMEKAAHKEKINKLIAECEQSFYKSFELKPKVLNQSLQLSEESSAEATSNNLLPAPDFSYQDRKYSDAQFRPFLRYFYYQPAKHFPHFDYFYSLIRKCKLRFERIKNTKGQSKPMSNVVIRIGIAGWFNDNNLKLISKRKGKEKMPEDAHLWPVSPLLCFQNESSSKSAIEVLRKNSACHKILIKSDEIYDDIKEVDDTIITIGQNKEQIKKSITKCLEEPLHSMLEEWLEYLKNYGSIRIASRLISEIETIREQMAFDESRMAAVASGLPMCAKAIVPEDVKNYLFGRNDVNSFGIWSNSSLKIFVQKMTNVTQLREELLRINRMFFEKYHLEIEERKLIEKRTLRQGDSILPNLPNENGTYNAGTLGGFVTKTDDERKIYALTCNHLFLDKNEANLAYADNSYGFREIGRCVFSTTDKSCDFAAIEIMDSFSDNCEVFFRREDEKKTNARLHTESLHPRIVHKIGAATNVTTGIICSPEWYKKILNDENREYIFLVEGIDEQFSEEGDSGALVFSRPKSMQQNYVDVLGMVYANDLIVYDDEDDQKSEKLEYSRSPYEGVEKKEVDSVEKPKLNISPVSHNNENEAAQNIQEGKNISCCYRLYTALELFQENQGEDFTVKFKDDLSSSSGSSSPSSKSDDSNQEPLE